MTQHTVNHTVYNPIDEYGANQQSPIDSLRKNPNEYAELANIVKSHFPYMTDEDIKNYLQKLCDEGCCYVAMINSLFEEFTNRRNEFKDIFGFDMTSVDGSFNYNHILVDLYCKMDNHNQQRFLFFTWDSYAKNEDRILYEDEDGTIQWRNKPYGNTFIQIKHRWETYCKRYGIKVRVKRTQDITPGNFHNYVQKGYVCISCSDYTMYDDCGKSTHVDNGHTMIITNVTTDYKYIVSSWGKRYTLDLDNVKGDLSYRLIQYQKRG